MAVEKYTTGGKLGEMLLKARQQKQLNQPDAARACNISVSFYCELERGETVTQDPEKLSGIARALDLDLNTMKIAVLQEITARARTRLGL